MFYTDSLGRARFRFVSPKRVSSREQFLIRKNPEILSILIQTDYQYVYSNTSDTISWTTNIPATQ